MLEISLDRNAGTRTSVSESFKTFNVNRTAAMRSVPHQAMVRIMFGCDRFCTYCIVPSVRGPEQNRPAAEIEEEVRRLADDGCLEITLLGQTVNSYRDASERRNAAAFRFALPAARHRRAPAVEIRHESSELHDRRSARGRPRLAQGLALSARAGAERLERNARSG